jgi:hypothetical protein
VHINLLFTHTQYAALACLFSCFLQLCLCLQILVVANPANTNALMLKEHAPSIPAENITALTRLDHNRALAQVRLAEVLGAQCDKIMMLANPAAVSASFGLA